MRFANLIPLLITFPLAGCALEVDGDEDEAADLDATEYILHNSLGTEALVLNSLIGNATAISQLTASPLRTSTFDPVAGVGKLRYALNDPNARQFMTYLTECALTTADVIQFPALNGRTYTFRGKAGLCPAWAGAAPTQACKEIVTACVLGRNNFAGDNINVSFRGEDTGGQALVLASKVRVKTTSLAGITIASFRACTGTLSGPARNCGFSTTQSFVGTCTPGADVTLNCDPTADTFVARVVNGIQGADHGSVLNLGEATVCGAGQPQTMDFECGDDGGFSVMIGPVTSGQALAGKFASATNGKFTAGEKKVYPPTNVEGAFYGTMLDPSRHNSVINREVLAGGTIVTSIPAGGEHNANLDAWACHSPIWTDGMAYLSHRLCAAVVDDNKHEAILCAASKLGACTGGGAPICATSDAPPVAGDKDYGGCKDGANVVRNWPLTTVLHLRCDLVAPGFEALCQILQ